MKTKILLIGLTIFLVNVISVNARETIKTCYDNYESNGQNYFVFPKDGGKPYGRTVEMLLTLTNALNLEVIIEQDKDWNNCLNKMRNGKADIVANISDKDDRRNYMELIPFLKWDDGSYSYFGISKKSKFASRIDEFKSVLLSNDEYAVINKTEFYSADQHPWEGKEILNAKKEELGKFYQSYAGLKQCYEIRKGYLAVHVNSKEMANYKSKAKSIENGIFNKYPELKLMKDEIWKKYTRTFSAKEYLDALLEALKDGTIVAGVMKMTNDLNSDTKSECDNHKALYNESLSKYGEKVTVEKDF